MVYRGWHYPRRWCARMCFAEILLVTALMSACLSKLARPTLAIHNVGQWCGTDNRWLWMSRPQTKALHEKPCLRVRMFGFVCLKRFPALRQAWMITCLLSCAVAPWHAIFDGRWLNVFASLRFTREILELANAMRAELAKYKVRLHVVDPDGHIDGCVWGRMKKCHHMLVFGCQNYSEDAELQFGHQADCLSTVSPLSGMCLRMKAFICPCMASGTWKTLTDLSISSGSFRLALPKGVLQ